MNRLIILVGMIGSGKSTLARKLAEDGAVICNDDAITLALHAGIYTKYDPELRPVYHDLRHAIIGGALRLGRTVVVDRTNLNPETRQGLIAIGKHYKVPVIAVVFPAVDPRVHARRRAEADGRGVSREQWETVAAMHYAKYVPPTLGEGFDAIITPDQV
jgi:protein phosphatase